MSEPQREHIDPVLVQRVTDGDEVAFDELYKAYEGQVFHIVRRRACNLDENECYDIVQEIFFTAWEEITANRFRPGGNFGNWILRIARNKAITARRKTWAREKRFPCSLQQHTADESYTLDAVGHEPSPDHGLLEREQRQHRDELLERLGKCLAQLPPADVEIVLLYHAQGMTYAEISAAVGLSISQVWKRHQRAVARLRELCGPATLAGPL